MLQVEIAHRSIRRYLSATRGPGAEYLSHGTSFVQRFFADFLESFDSGPFEIEGIRLVEVDSHRSDIEVLHRGSASFVIFDQSMLHVFGATTTALLLAMAGERADHRHLLNALFANRYLSLGYPDDAAWQAQLSSLMATDRHLYPHERAQRDAWVKAQACFAIGHEVMHTRVRVRTPGVVDESRVLSRLLAADYESRLRPTVRAIDLADPGIGLKSDLWDSPWRVVPGTEGSFRPRFTGRDLSCEARLQWIINTPSGFGEEVMCDYGSLLGVARIVGGNWLPPNDALAAAYVGLASRLFLNIVENRILGYTSRAPDDILITASRAEQIQTRLLFARLALGPICRSGVAKELRGKSTEIVASAADARWRDLRDVIAKIDACWTEPMLKMVSREDQWSDRAGKTVKIPEIPRDIDMDDLIALRDHCRFGLAVDLGF